MQEANLGSFSWLFWYYLCKQSKVSTRRGMVWLNSTDKLNDLFGLYFAICFVRAISLICIDSTACLTFPPDPFRLWNVLSKMMFSVCRSQIVEAQYDPIPPGHYSDKLSETVTRWVGPLHNGFFLGGEGEGGRGWCHATYTERYVTSKNRLQGCKRWVVGRSVTHRSSKSSFQDFIVRYCKQNTTFCSISMIKNWMT